VAVFVTTALAAAAWNVRDHVPLAWRVRASTWIGAIQVDHGVRVAMPDGVELAASLYRPGKSRGPLPTVLLRLPYDRLNYDEALYSASFFARNGYAVLVQDARGKFGSQGLFAPWEKSTSDGAATLDWIVRQAWSNGKVGTFGCSALGEMQYSLARARHPAHAAMVASGAGGAWGLPQPNLDQGGFHEGGVLMLASTFGWTLQHGQRDPNSPKAENVDMATALQSLPLIDMVSRVQPGENVFTDYLRMPPGDPGWQRFDLVEQGDRIDVPALVINTWGDQTLQGTLELAEMARRQAGTPGRQHVVIAPGNHCDYIGTMASHKFGELDVDNVWRPYGQWFLRWFEQKLTGTGQGLADLPPYQFYVLGEDRWLASSQWPPEGAEVQRWYLGSGGRANSRHGNGTLAPAMRVDPGADRFDADPMRPVPTRGGPICCTGNPDDRSGPVDQSDVEQREDVLVYTSEPLAKPLRIAGVLRARLTVSSSAPDTDFVVRLVHVRPDGRATNIQEGALRLRYRNGPNRAAPLKAAEQVTITVPMRSIAYRLPAGHRLRVHVAGSSFPRLERNLNTGGNNYDETVGIIAHNTVHHGSDSYIELPILDDEQASSAP